MAITIYRTHRSELESDVEDKVSQLENWEGVEITHKRYPAVIGELAGEAVQILTSDSVQAFTKLVEIGGLVWATIRALREAGRYFDIGKSEAEAIAAHEAEEEIEQDVVPTPVVWGPMEARPESGVPKEHLARENPGIFFVGVVTPRPNDRARTYWYLISKKGEISVSWHTQTLRERLPDFLSFGKNAS
jgi:hypothetical protein